MRIQITILLSLMTGITLAQSSLLIGKTWAYKKVSVIYQRDTLVIFHADSAKNVWYLGKVSLAFQVNNSYVGTDIKGLAQLGTWSMLNGPTMIIDKDTNQVLSLINGRLITSTPTHYKDDSINVQGTLLTEFYSIISSVITCESRQSGDWRNPAVWSCNREPTTTDVVVINLGHIITITSDSAQAQRIIHNGGKLWFTSVTSKLLLSGTR